MLKKSIIIAAVAVVVVLAAIIWFFASGRAARLREVTDEFNRGAAEPGAVAVRQHLPACSVAALFDTRGFWESSPELQAKFPRMELLPKQLLVCGVRKHAEPPDPSTVARAYATVLKEPAGIVVVVLRGRVGEKVWMAESFPALSPESPGEARP